MSAASGKIVTISIDGGLLATHDGLVRHESQLAQLIEMLADYSLPATWFLADPSGNRWTPQIACSHPQHEIALGAAGVVWASTSVPDGVFDELLRCSLWAARSAGLAIHSLAVRDPLTPSRSAIAAEQGLRVAHIATSHRNEVSGSLTTVAADVVLPYSEGVWSLVHDYAAARQMLARFRHRRHCHIAIDLDCLGRHATLGMDALRRLMRSVAIERHRATLDVVPLANLGAGERQHRRRAA